MKEEEKKEYLDKYKKAKEKGVPFFPDIIFKDVVVSLIILIILALLAFYLGAPVEARANPNDTNYTPRPEWYFLFLFQLLKYFPGKLEVVGAMILPGLFIGLLLLLPFLDRSPKRHFRLRPFASLAAVGVLLGIGALTFLAANEAPPPQEAVVVDQAADLYARNCANCHGASIDIPAGIDLHQVIAGGNHQGMPAWGGDLSTDEIDMLVGFILSPNGSALFTRECAGCHKNPIQATGNPVELQRVIDEGATYPAHVGQDIPNWKETLGADEQNALLNFLAAPDGQRLFVINCSGCHGEGIAFSGTVEDLKKLIVEGGHEVKMPGWKGTLSEANLNSLADYVVAPGSNAAGNQLFGQYCASCHGDKVPVAPDKASALTMIESGGAHVTMPVWGSILTPAQVDALVTYTLESGSGTGVTAGAKLFANNCQGCHGKFGEGGPNPTRAGDIIAPISSSEYLKTRDDATLRNIIMQGQPDFGMSPFGSSYGGLLNDDQVTALVAFLRNWERNPPAVTAPTSTATTEPTTNLSAQQIYDGICAQCHGRIFEGTKNGSALVASDLQSRYDFQALFNLVNFGILRVGMPGIGHMFSEDQVRQVVSLVSDLDATTGMPGTTTSGGGELGFAGQILPILKARCTACHASSSGQAGFNSSSYQTFMTSGEDGPQIKAGDAANSSLVKLLQAASGFMPPMGKLSDAEIQVFIDWINAGAKDN
jgi:mono/diheme cytochrome c family protein